MPLAHLWARGHKNSATEFHLNPYDYILPCFIHSLLHSIQGHLKVSTEGWESTNSYHKLDVLEKHGCPHIRPGHIKVAFQTHQSNLKHIVTWDSISSEPGVIFLIALLSWFTSSSVALQLTTKYNQLVKDCSRIACNITCSTLKYFSSRVLSCFRSGAKLCQNDLYEQMQLLDLKWTGEIHSFKCEIHATLATWINSVT